MAHQHYQQITGLTCVEDFKNNIFAGCCYGNPTFINTRFDQALFQEIGNYPVFFPSLMYMFLAKIEVKMTCQRTPHSPDSFISSIGGCGKGNQLAACHILPVNKLAEPVHTIRVVCKIHDDGKAKSSNRFKRPGVNL